MLPRNVGSSSHPSNNDVNDQILRVNQAMGFFKDKEEEIDTLRNSLSTLNTHARNNRLTPNLSDTARYLYEGICKDSSRCTLTLDNVSQIIQKGLSLARQNLEQLENIQNNLGKVKSSKIPSLIAKATELDASVSESVTLAQSIQTAVGRGGIVGGINMVSNSLAKLKERMDSANQNLPPELQEHQYSLTDEEEQWMFDSMNSENQ